MEDGSRPIVQEPLVPTKGGNLSTEVSSELNSIFLSGLLAEGDLDTRAMDAIGDLSVADALAILQEFRATNLSSVTNKSALICTLIKSQRQKSRVRGGPDDGCGDGSRGSGKCGPDEAKLKEILERTKYSHEVSTGQRKYGGPPPDWTGPQPGAGHELYCGKLPKDVYEDTLIPLFEKYGTIWDMRLMMDPVTGRNRGYCFVTYTDKTNTQEAITALNNFEIQPNRPLRVNLSVSNVRLFVGNIPKNRSRDEIKEEFEKHTENLVDVIVYNSPDDARKKNRGFAFLDYDSHKSASAAKRIIGAGHLRVWGSEVYVEWAEPQEEPDDDTMSKVKVLYVRNLTSTVTEAQLKEAFELHGTVERTKRVKGYGFVHFAEREAAVKAMEALNGTKLGDLEMEISLAKPSSKNRKNDRRRLQQFNHGGGAGYANGWGYNEYDYWSQPYGGYYGGGVPNMRTGKEYDYYSGYDNYATDNSDYYGGYNAQGYGYYGGYGGRYNGASQRRGTGAVANHGGDGWYGNGSQSNWNRGYRGNSRRWGNGAGKR